MLKVLINGEPILFTNNDELFARAGRPHEVVIPRDSGLRIPWDKLERFADKNGLLCVVYGGINRFDVTLIPEGIKVTSPSMQHWGIDFYIITQQVPKRLEQLAEECATESELEVKELKAEIQRLQFRSDALARENQELRDRISRRNRQIAGLRDRIEEIEDEDDC